MYYLKNQNDDVSKFLDGRCWSFCDQCRNRIGYASYNKFYASFTVFVLGGEGGVVGFCSKKCSEIYLQRHEDDWSKYQDHEDERAIKAGLASRLLFCCVCGKNYPPNKILKHDKRYINTGVLKWNSLETEVFEGCMCKSCFYQLKRIEKETFAYLETKKLISKAQRSLVKL
jgi:hypothetical protein